MLHKDTSSLQRMTHRASCPRCWPIPCSLNSCCGIKYRIWIPPIEDCAIHSVQQGLSNPVRANTTNNNSPTFLTNSGKSLNKNIKSKGCNVKNGRYWADKWHRDKLITTEVQATTTGPAITEKQSGKENLENLSVFVKTLAVWAARWSKNT